MIHVTAQPEPAPFDVEVQKLYRITFHSLCNEYRYVFTALCTLEGPCMEYGSVNRNNRVYTVEEIDGKAI